MRRTFRLTASNPRQSVDLDFDAAAIVVNNPTASPVYVRVGAPDIPSESNADLIVAAAENQSYPTGGVRTFGLALGSSSLLETSGAIALSGLFSTVIVTFLDANERVPAYGSTTFLSLSLTDLTGGFINFAHATQSAIFDIGAWGGALVGLVPDSTSGQGEIFLQVSSDRVTFRTVGAWAVWPNSPFTIQIPRTARYFKIVFNQPTISGEPSLSGVYSVRATINEIPNILYTPSAGAISKSYNVPDLGEQSFVFVTRGLPAVNLALLSSTGISVLVIIETSESSSGPWSRASTREQFVATQWTTIYRSIGMLDAFIRIRISDIGSGGLTGTLKMSIQPDVDLTQALQNIYTALGDVGNPIYANQSIFHQLNSIRLYDSAIWTSLGFSSNQDIGSLNAIGQLRGIYESVGTAVGQAQGTLNTIGQLRSIAHVSGAQSDSRLATTIIGQLKQIAWSLTTLSTTGGVPDNVYTWLDALGFRYDPTWSGAGVGSIVSILKYIGVNSSLIQYVLNALTVNSTTGGQPDNVKTELQFIRTGQLTSIQSNTANIQANTANIQANTAGASLATTADLGTGTGSAQLCATALSGTVMIGWRLSGNTAGYYSLRLGTGSTLGPWLFEGYLQANSSIITMLPYNNYMALTTTNRLWITAPSGAAWAAGGYTK